MSAPTPPHTISPSTASRDGGRAPLSPDQPGPPAGHGPLPTDDGPRHRPLITHRPRCRADEPPPPATEVSTAEVAVDDNPVE